MIKKFYNRKRFRESDHGQVGFTLIEFLTVAFIFSMVGVLLIMIFAKAVQIERKAFAIQAVQENILAVFGIMTKDIRVGRIVNQDIDCSSGLPSPNLEVYTYPSGSEVMVTYSLVNGKIIRDDSSYDYQMSTEDVVFETLGFCISGSDYPDNLSPKITIIAKATSSKYSNVSISAQTTMVSRDILDEMQN